jgi:heme-degrading monooxygenase HmoA
MFVSIGIHSPRPGKEDSLVDSMHRFGAAMNGQPGFRRAYSMRDEQTGRLVALVVWDSKDNWLAARSAMLAAVKDDPFEEWEDIDPDVLRLKPI